MQLNSNEIQLLDQINESQKGEKSVVIESPRQMINLF